MTNPGRTGVTTYTTPSDTEIVITRVVDAPRSLVFEAYTTPRHLQRWLLGPPGWTMPVCEFDPRPGGAWRYVWRKANGTELPMGGMVLEFVPPERVVTTERWGPKWPETLNTLVLTEAAGQTTLTLTVAYPSKEARDAALRTGMKDGTDVSYARLDELLRELV